MTASIGLVVTGVALLRVPRAQPQPLAHPDEQPLDRSSPSPKQSMGWLGAISVAANLAGIVGLVVAIVAILVGK